MPWDGAATERSIWSAAKKGDEVDVSYLRGCYLKGPEGDPKLKGSWSYPYRSSPDAKPDCGGLLAAEQRAKGTGNDMTVARKARRLRARYCGASSQDSEDVCLNSGELIETDDELIVKVAVMHTGVYNNKLKLPEELEESVRWWNGKEIVLQSAEKIGDHPDSGITTAKTIRVGQLLNPTWDSEQLRINAEAHFLKELTPEWLQLALRNHNVLGVSGAYFCDFLNENGEEGGKKYDAIELNYVPNNLAIVESPACKPPECGLNVNSTSDTNYLDSIKSIVEEAIKNYPMVYTNTTGTTSIVNTNTSEEINMTEDMVKKTEFDELKVQLDSEKKSSTEKIALLETEKIRLNTENETLKKKLSDIELESKKARFLSQFPEVNREKAEKELLPLFLEKPEELIMNAAKVTELMTVPKLEESEGAEFVPELDSETVSVDYAAKMMGLKK